MTEEKKPTQPHLFHSKDGVCTLQLTEVEIDALLQVLHFANTAATVLGHQEMKTPGGIKNAAKMNRVASDSKELMRIVSTSIAIGEPASDEKN